MNDVPVPGSGAAGPSGGCRGAEPPGERYARQIALPSVGAEGQARLAAARVLVAGLGGLGSPLLLYLAAAGVGHIGLLDDDAVSLSNLQRQIAHATESVGRPKVASALAAARALNPTIDLIPHQTRLARENAASLVGGYTIVCDGTDNFVTRFRLADACHAAGRTLVSAAVQGFEGQLATFVPGGPCYRCLHPDLPPDALVPGCEDVAVLGPVAGVLGTLQALEVLKLILGVGETLAGRLLLWDGLLLRQRIVTLAKDPGCLLCGA